MASPKGDLPKRGFVQQNLTSTLQPNKPNRGVLLMDIFIIACIFLKSNQKRQKIIFFLLLSQIREGEKKGRSLLRISEMNKENEIIKGQEQRRAPMPCFSFCYLSLYRFFFISPSCVGTGAHLSFLLLSACPGNLSFLSPFYPFPFLLSRKKKSDPAACHFCHASFLRLFRGKRRIANIPPLRHKMKTRRRSNPERRKEKIRVTGG